MDEVQQINDFMSTVGDDIQVIWGASFDEQLGENVKITLIATGYQVSDIPGMPLSAIKPLKSEQKTPVITYDESMNPVEDLSEITSMPEEQTVIEKVMETYYPDASKAPDVKVKLPDEELETFILDDLDDEDKLRKAVNIPSWKRKLMKNN